MDEGKLGAVITLQGGQDAVRIAVFGDIHGNIPALDAVIADGCRLGVEQWFCLGDLAAKGPMPNTAIERVRELGPTQVIVGNTDQWLFQGLPDAIDPESHKGRFLATLRDWGHNRLSEDDLSYLQGLPFSHRFELGSHHILVMHSSPQSTEAWLPATLSSEELASRFTGHDADIVVYGHIHTPFVRPVAGKVLVNTGSVGNPTDGDPSASYLLLESDGDDLSLTLRRISFDIGRAVEIAHDAGLPYSAEYEKALRTGSPF